MTTWTRARWFVLLATGVSLVGCAEEPGTSVNPTPPSVVTPSASDEAKPAESTATAPTPEGPVVASPEPAEALADKPAEPASLPDLAAAAPAADPVESTEGVALIPIQYKDYLAKIAEGKAKLTLVDAWATWCAPCKENFPHVLEMDQKYASKGLKVISLSMDDPAEPKMVAEAKKFLNEKKSTITNYLLDHPLDEGFEFLNINGIPAVFLFGPDGKEIKRFTMDDPNNQFTYEQVEQEIVKMLEASN